MKRISWILVLCMGILLLCLTACGSGDAGTPSENQLRGDQSAAAPPAADSDAFAALEEPDYDAAYAALPADTVVMTVNGEEVLWQEYYRWLYYIMTQMQESGTVTEWDAPSQAKPDYTNAEYAEYYAQSAVTQYHVVAQTAEARNVVLNEEEKEALRQRWEDYAGLFREEEDLLAHLEAAFTSKDQYLFERETALLYESLFAARYGENGEKCTDAQAAAFAENNDYIRIRYLLLLTVDEDQMLLDETTVQEKKTRIDDLYRQIMAAEDPVAEFETLYAEYNEDMMAGLYPDGYTCSLDTVPNVELRDTIAAMPDYGISEPVQGAYGYYILYRLPLDYDGIVEFEKDSERAYSLRYLAATDLFHNEIAELFAAAEVVFSEELEALEPEQLFGLN